MRILCYGIGLLILSVFQPTLIKSLAIYGITPNLFLIAAVIFGFLRGKNEGAIGGFILGLVFDLLVGRFIGLNAILYMYVGFCTGSLGEYYFRQSGVLVAMIFTIISTLITSLVYFLAYFMVFEDVNFLNSLTRTILPECLYNGLFAAIMFFIVKRILKIFKLTTY